MAGVRSKLTGVHLPEASADEEGIIMVTLRIRSIVWFISGLMLAVVSVWALSALRADAVNPAESSIISVTPERILDTRDPVNLGLNGPFVSQVSQKLQVTGSVPTATGTKVVVPDGATGVVMTVTPVNATADGFVSIEPGNSTGQPTTSNLNFTAGAINPISVTATMPTTGADKGNIRITYDAFGNLGPTTDILIDVVGYTTNAGLQELQSRLNTQLSRLDADIKMGHSPHGMVANSTSVPTVKYNGESTEVGGNGFMHSALSGPTFIQGQPRGLKSVEYCIQSVQAGATITQFKVFGYKPGNSAGIAVLIDNTVRAGNGCFSANTSNAKGYEAYSLEWKVASVAATTLRFQSIETVWARETTL
jgi:hypothetical protein